MKVCDLTPGDVVELNGFRGTFILRQQHPLWQTLQLVIWRLDDGRVSFDALDANQEVGNVVSSNDTFKRMDSIREALGIGTPPRHWGVGK